MAQIKMAQLSDEVTQLMNTINAPPWTGNKWITGNGASGFVSVNDAAAAKPDDSYFLNQFPMTTIAGTCDTSTMASGSEPAAPFPIYGTEMFELADNVLIVSVKKLKDVWNTWFVMKDVGGKQHAMFYIRSHKTGRFVKMIYLKPGALPVDWISTRPDYVFPLFFMVAPVPGQEDLMKKGLNVAVTE